ncbi:hypothetical protein QMZ93_07280 [Pantoea stewartii subsp. indologenes]|uniref:hypothetical protein n=1 Tax=Pantoea stewartii TaxID=66269 RepID=UPI0024DF994D|nr:hypothetical protein [Pantoea stewartii]MDK2633144.1 hypothetical protein [Pantoea stewartii subsp. indologenes]
MASNKKANYSARVKFWANGITSECSGGMMGCISAMFTSLPKENRETLMKQLEERHVSVCAWEAERVASEPDT